MEIKLEKLLDNAIESRSSLLLPAREGLLIKEVEAYFQGRGIGFHVLSNDCITNNDLGEINSCFLKKYESAMTSTKSVLLFDIWPLEQGWLKHGSSRQLDESFEFMQSLFRKCLSCYSGRKTVVGVINYFTYSPITKKGRMGILNGDKFIALYQDFDLIYDGYSVIDSLGCRKARSSGFN